LSNHFAFVDSQQAIEEAMRRAPDAVLVTDNPLLADAPFTDGRVRNIDRLLDQKTSLALGMEALRLADVVDVKLQEHDVASKLGLVKNHLRIGGASSRLFSSLIYRAAVMARALAGAQNIERMSVFSADEPAFNANVPFIASRFASPYIELAKYGFFEDLSVDTYPVNVPLPETVNETATENLILKVAMIPLGFLLMRLLKISRLNFFRKKQIYIGGENEALRETMPWLLVYGFQFTKLGKLITAPEYAYDKAGVDNIAAVLEPIIGPVIEESLMDTGEFTSIQSKAVRSNAIAHLAMGLDALRQFQPALEKRLGSFFANANAGAILLTNGLFGATGAQVYGYCRNHGIKVVDFEHGVTTGLSPLSQAKIEYSEVASCDVLMVSSDTATKGFSKAKAAKGKVIHTIGLADKVRKLSFPWLQRFLVRRRLGIRSSETAVFHISTYTHSANVRPGWGTPTESVVHDISRDLVNTVYRGLAHRVFYKPYPTQRFAYEPSYASMYENVSNIEFLTVEDFRYSRSAADIIVTSTPTSTFGWCVGCDVPIIWLDSQIINPLIDAELRQQFWDSFICVDLDEGNWQDKLRSLLNQDVGVLQKEWADKSQARQALVEASINGPSGSVGRRAAKFIAALSEHEFGKG